MGPAATTSTTPRGPVMRANRGQVGRYLSSLDPVRSADPRHRGWLRQLEGWQLGVVAVGIAALAATLLAPVGAAPSYLPVPPVDRREQAHVAGQDRELAAATAASGLHFDVRVVGERVRRFGAASARQGNDAASGELGELRVAFDDAVRRHGDPPLVALRSVQTEAFLSAVRHWEATGLIDAELEELGGDLPRVARANCWTIGRRLALSEAERRTLFRVRWAELVGAVELPPYAPSLNEWRAYYRLLLERPERGEPAHGVTAAAGEADPRRLLATVNALGRRDPEYPVLFARGVLLSRLGEPRAAADNFGSFLAGPETSALRAWARNHLATALATLPPGAPPP